MLHAHEIKEKKRKKKTRDLCAPFMDVRIQKMNSDILAPFWRDSSFRVAAYLLVFVFSPMRITVMVLGIIADEVIAYSLFLKRVTPEALKNTPGQLQRKRMTKKSRGIKARNTIRTDG